MTKRILSCFLAILFCALCLAGCAGEDDGVPEGMYSATKKGEPFILYVPGDWSDNCDSGISSATIMTSGAFVSARKCVLDKPTLDKYVEDTVEQYRKIYKDADFNSVEISSKESLNKKTAIKNHFTFKEVKKDDSGNTTTVNRTVIQYYAQYGKDSVILLSFYCPTDRYEDYEDDITRMKTEFVILENAKDNNDKVVDEDTPKGMKNASFEGGEYAFYVPESWKTDMSDKMTEATSKNGKCNVTVTCFVPSFEMTVGEYFELCEAQYKTDLGGTYERLEDETAKVHINTVTAAEDEKNATTFVYKLTIEENTYKLSQTIFYYNGVFYSITYTALSEKDFDDNLADLNKMIKNCRFK